MKVKQNGQPTSTFLWKQALATAASTWIPFCGGITFGMSAVMLPQLREDKSIEYDSSLESWIASAATLTIIIGSLISGPLLDSFGRKTTHFIAFVPYFIGWTVIACANSTSAILAGKLIAGLLSGASKVVTMTYVAEITDPKLRSIFLFMPYLTRLLGVIVSHTIGHLLYWKTSAIFYICVAIIPSFAFVFLKESPFWLIGKGKIDEGVESFRWYRGSCDTSEAELKAILERQSEKAKISAKEIFNTMKTKAFIKLMLITMVVSVNINFTGIGVITVYAIDIFQKAFKGNVDPFVLMITMDCIECIITIGISAFGMMIPKRNALIACSFCHSLSVLGLVACFLLNYDVLWIPVLCLVMYISFSSVVATIGWSFVPELLPNGARGVGSGLNSAFAYMVSFALAKTAPDLLNLYGEAALFASYGIPTFICGFILYFILPDTHGKSLQSIEDAYTKKSLELIDTRL